MWVFSAGMPRSGSTLQYQLTAELIETAGLGRRLTYTRTSEFPQVRAEHKDDPDLLVYKSHHCSADIQAEFAAGNAKAVYTYRDLRDVYASRMRMREVGFRAVWREGFLDSCLDDDRKWRSLDPVYVCRYEDMINDLPGEVARLAAFFGITLDQAACQQIADRYSFDKQKDRIDANRSQPDQKFDPQSLLHGNHLTAVPGSSWSETLTPDQAARIEHKTADWLKARGYPLLDPDPSLLRKLRLMWV
ncbi:sulfotransferase domain-containing protein [Mucisphaera calidilacus]|uniref:Sulfotransferase domain protein n=1 Tax=Mucisphaera calidilacus TaxID=2527982 RepID=A0A518BT91_9BACT|nr:sulfotransferase domain-containing protein [Mucisphaera calidilacus]QDU70191.1 Sulfotransferase domain protein [Mucisphaera calidilacus]